MLKALKSILQRLYPYGIFRAGKDVYLTFDDGPIPEVTPKLLEILDRYHVKATFFMVGENIEKHPEVFKQVAEAGHSIGNHTYNHFKGWNYSKAEYMENVKKCQEAIETQLSIVNYQLSNVNLFRPPYGKATFFQCRALSRMGYKIIFWDILTQDYNSTQTPEMMLCKIKRQVRPGSIINFHDSLKSNERMLAVLPKTIEYLQSRGYKLMPL